MEMYSSDVISVQQGFPRCSSRSWCQSLCYRNQEEGQQKRKKKQNEHSRSRYTPDLLCR